MKIGEWVASAAARLQEVSDAPRLEAQVLAAFAFGGSDRSWVLAHAMDEVETEFVETLLERRLGREPLAYITGQREFWKHSFLVGPGVLIPRQETEVLLEAALSFPGGNVLDLGCGSGALAISLALERPDWSVTGADISLLALEWSRKNGSRLGANVTWVESDGFQNAPGPWDLIVTNPPYVGTNEVLAPELHDHEPHSALYAGPDGLDFYARLAREARDVLQPHGAILMEIGHNQSEAVPRLFLELGWQLAGQWNDLSGNVRVLGFRP